MEFIAGHFSAIGISKLVNQDSICLLQAVYNNENIIMAVICDGMGGLDCGEIASSSGVFALAKWFEKRLPIILEDYSEQKVIRDWKNIIKRLNERLCEYGKERDIKLGTTLSVILIRSNGKYVLGHVGDSRIYEVRGGIKLLTEDQSLVADEARRGIITWQQAKTDRRRNILIECIGVSEDVSPVFSTGSLRKKRCQILICSDGFCHELTDSEISDMLGKGFDNKQDIIECLKVMENRCEARGEQDNISAALICCRGKKLFSRLFSRKRGTDKWPEKGTSLKKDI